MSSVSDPRTPTHLERAVALDPKTLWRTLQVAFGLLLVLTATTELVAMLLIDHNFRSEPIWFQVAFDTGFLVLVVGAAGRLLIAGPLAQRFSAQHAQLASRTTELEAHSQQQQTEAQLRRAFEMADDEPRVLRIVERAFGEVAAGSDVELLIAAGDPPTKALPALAMISAHTGSRLSVLRAMEASERAATTDPLTGLYNRRSLESRVDTLLRAGERFAVVMADIDHFKKLNDTHGHSVGDRTLQTFSRTLRGTMRPEDVVARYGGEEFVVIIVGTSANEAASVMERTRTELPTATARAGVPSVTASYGVTDSTQAGTLEALLRIADEALYTAKREGRDRVVCAGPQGISAVPAEASGAIPVSIHHRAQQ